MTNRSTSQTPRARGNRQTQTSTDRTNALKAPRLALYSPSETTATPEGLKNTRTKRHTERHTTNRPAEQTTKQQRARPTPGPSPQNGQ